MESDSDNENALFLNRYGDRLSVKSIKQSIQQAYSNANIDDSVYSTHTLRHTCATLLYRTGIDIKVIQELLGHVKLDTTEIYAHLYNKSVMDALMKHPLSKFKMCDAESYCAA